MENLNTLFIDFNGTLAEFRCDDGPDKYAAKGYTATLLPQENVVEAVRYIIKNKLMNVVFTGAVLPYEYCIEERYQWMKKYLPEVTEFIFSDYGKSKLSAMINYGIRKGDVLLDDYNVNLQEGIDHAVIPVKLVNQVNDMHHSWCGARVSAFTDPEILAMQIVGISEMQKRRIK